MAGFVDEAQVHVKAGDGGAGAVAFRREAHVARGGPDGGDAGSGGDVFLEATRSAVSLLGFRDHPHRRAEDGTHGGGAKRHGRNGDALVVAVPEGTVIRSLDGDVLADLAHPGDRLLAARGGRGGRGNASFLTNKLRAPAFAEQGEVGEELWLDLELKLLADVALVGFPNAGKSTLISRISAAKPKIADYPFTTLEPHLGVVRMGGHGPGGRGLGATEYIVADVPGLIEGASEGRGLGHRFLRHVERARVLVILVDLAPSEGRPPADQVRILLDELGRYRPELVTRPRVIVGSRADCIVSDERPDPAVYGGALEISSATGEGLPELTQRLALLVSAARDAAPEPSTAPVLHRPEPEGVLVEREGEGWVVLGRQASRAVAVSDLTNADAILYVQRRLKRLGVDRALVRAGAREGDPVRIGALSFEFSPDH
ncbi:MAG: GTP-binding protein Obg/CgtA [Acidimicrobiaceae bacterium]|jgi:GTP-binding protein|nr:GTP-binding protein Obg/CgtA [Acidimicrobiaceae bacterium]